MLFASINTYVLLHKLCALLVLCIVRKICAIPLLDHEVFDHTSLSKDDVEQVRQTLSKLSKFAQQEYFGRAADNTFEGQFLVAGASAGDKPAYTQLVSAHANRYLFEGDILLTPRQADDILQSVLSVKRRSKRALINQSKLRWSDFPIAYNFHYSLTQSDIADITAAISFWETHTCVSYRFEANPTGDSIQFFKGQGCYSMIGKIGGQQSISIGRGCNQLGVVAHEIGHSLGLWHQQSRPDSVDFIRIQPQNIISAFISNFLRRDWSEVVLYGIPYDLGSVMHYGPQAFVNDWSKNTIETTYPGYQNTIGQREFPAFYDVKMINKAYCSHVCSKNSTLDCKYGGYANPRDCSHCVCPSGLGGRLCDTNAPSVKATCGGVLNVKSAWTEFTSPGYPSTYYQPGMECHWLIRSPPGTQVLLEFVERFQFYCTVTCIDYVEVKNGSDFARTGMRFCCFQTPYFQFVSDTNEMVVSMRANVGTDVGFKARVRQDPVTEVVTDATSTRTTTTTTPSTSTSTTTTSTTTTTTTTSTGSTTTPAASTSSAHVCTTSFSVSAESVTLQTTSSTASSNHSWAEWGDWSDCSRTCGACGLKIRNRKCPASGSCDGESQQYKRCNFQACGAKEHELCVRLQLFDYPCGSRRDQICSDPQEVQFKCQLPHCCAPFQPVDGECRLHQDSLPVIGPPPSEAALWGPWSPWGPCTGPPCGGCSLQSKRRFCRGRSCSGSDSQYRRCNFEICRNCTHSADPEIARDEQALSVITCPCCAPLHIKDGRCSP